MQLGAKGVTAYTCASTSSDISTDAAVCTRVYGTLLFWEMQGDGRCCAHLDDLACHATSRLMSRVDVISPPRLTENSLTWTHQHSTSRLLTCGDMLASPFQYMFHIMSCVPFQPSTNLCLGACMKHGKTRRHHADVVPEVSKPKADKLLGSLRGSLLV
jgi:hypothetical protein